MATRELLAAREDKPVPPIMLSGSGERMIRLGGREADIFSFSIMAGITAGLAPEDAFGRRVQVRREAADDRFDGIELNLFVAAVGDRVENLDLAVIRQAAG